MLVNFVFSHRFSESFAVTASGPNKSQGLFSFILTLLFSYAEVTWFDDAMDTYSRYQAMYGDVSNAVDPPISIVCLRNILFK